MKRVPNKYLMLILFGSAMALVLSRIATRHSGTVVGGNWITVTRPVPGNRTNATVTTPAISFCVSNVGPEAVDLRVGWFECRAKRDRTKLATNQLASVNIAFPPGARTNLTIDLCPTTVAPDEWLCSCRLDWVERRTGLRRVANALNNWTQLNLNFALFEPKALDSGLVYTGNVRPAEYFHLMYGLPRASVKDTYAERLPPAAESTAPRSPPRLTSDKEAEDAFVLFSAFGESTFSSSRMAENGTHP